MQTVERVIIQASRAAIWQVLADVESWSCWNPTILQVKPLTNRGLRVGSRYRIAQPKLRPAVYEVTECVPHQAFTWVVRAPGARMIADHRLNAGDGAGTEVELSFATEGVLGAILGGLYAKRIADYVRTEARSLKAHCESLDVAASA
ncbi:MAG: SRPBCC family protein [Acidobacteriaceae bacterium]